MPQPKFTYQRTFPVPKFFKPKSSPLNPYDPNFDPSAEIYFAAVPNAFSNSDKNTINAAFVSLKAGTNNFSKIDKLFLHANSTRGNAKIDLINPGVNSASEINGSYINWDKGGFTNKVTLGQLATIDSNYTPSTNAVNYSINNACYFYWSNTNIASNSYYDIGVYDATGRNSYLNIRIATDQASGGLMSQAGAVTINGSTNSLGLITVKKVGTTLSVYRNTTLLGSATISNPPGLNTLSMQITSVNVSGVISSPSIRQISLSGWGSGSIDVTELYNSLSAPVNYFSNQQKPIFAFFAGQSNNTDISNISGNLPAPMQAELSNAYSFAPTISGTNGVFLLNFRAGYNTYYANFSGTKYGISASFAYKLSTTYGRKVYVTNPSKGGTSLANPGTAGTQTWNPNNGSSLLPAAIANNFNPLYAYNPNLIQPICVWFQGEQDSGSLGAANNNNTGLIDLINKMRDTIANGGTGISNLKFVFISLVSNNGFESTINNFRQDISNPSSVNYIAGCYYLNIAPYVTTYDTVHLDPASQITAGNMLADLLNSIF